MYTSFLIALMATAPLFARAESGSVGLINPLNVDSVQGLLVAIIDIMLTFALPIVVLFIIWSGFRMVMAQGNDTALRAARARFKNIMVGALVIFGAKLILYVIKSTIESI